MTTSCYIHIPFCNTICSYCNFVKTYNIENMVDEYLIGLKEEVVSNYNNEYLKTIYIGGGSPDCLNLDQLKKLMEITKLFNKDESLEFTIELNIENITEEKLKLLKNYGVNRVSVGVQTFNEKFLKYLNRNHTKELAIKNINLIKKYFDNINVDLMYALKNQTLDDLEKDIDEFLKLSVNHISMYSLIIEKYTKLYNEKEEYIDEDLDASMHDLIIKRLEDAGYDHYEVSNFSKKNYVSKHNLVYWDNKEYYGFGISASGYVNNIRYKNTTGFTNYLNKKYKKEEEYQTKELKMSYEMILGLRKTKGINVNEFKDKYNISIFDVYDINSLIKKEYLVLDKDYLYIPRKYKYVANEILINFL